MTGDTIQWLLFVLGVQGAPRCLAPAHQTKQKKNTERWWALKWIFPHVFINWKYCYLHFRLALVEAACHQKNTAYFLCPDVFSKGWEAMLVPNGLA